MTIEITRREYEMIVIGLDLAINRYEPVTDVCEDYLRLDSKIRNVYINTLCEDLNNTLKHIK